MNIPNVPKIPTIQNSTEHRVFLTQIVNQLQTFLSDERYLLPQQPTINVLKLNEAVDKFGNKKNPGSILYNSTTKSGQINNDGIYKTLATYEELTAAEITSIPSGERNGRFIFETDTGDLRVGMNNLFKTVTVT